jgi:GT2 family glycosyltransferase
MGVFPYYTLYRREWLLDVGGYDEGFEGSWAWDDVDLNGRLSEIGHHTFRIEECEGLHQWHPSRIELAVENEARARSKRWPMDVTANKGNEWGVVIPRP